MNRDESKLVVAAVSGGIDSVVMLDKLVRQGGRPVVAHVDHGIRGTSDRDEAFVRQLAESYGLPYVSTRLELGSGASEDVARQHRYKWLDSVRRSYGASQVTLGHHQDDVIETMLINLLRGTGWRGLSSLRSTATRARPLLGLSKAEVVAYAIGHDLAWREDETNDSPRYLRNRVRLLLVPKLTATGRRTLLDLYDKQISINLEVTEELTQLLARFKSENGIDRHPIIMADNSSGRELLRAWLGEPLERRRLDDLLRFAKTSRAGDRWSWGHGKFIVAYADRLVVLETRG